MEYGDISLSFRSSEAQQVVNDLLNREPSPEEEDYLRGVSLLDCRKQDRWLARMPEMPVRRLATAVLLSYILGNWESWRKLQWLLRHGYSQEELRARKIAHDLLEERMYIDDDSLVEVRREGDRWVVVSSREPRLYPKGATSLPPRELVEKLYREGWRAMTDGDICAVAENFPDLFVRYEGEERAIEVLCDAIGSLREEYVRPLLPLLSPEGRRKMVEKIDEECKDALRKGYECTVLETLSKLSELPEFYLSDNMTKLLAKATRLSKSYRSHPHSWEGEMFALALRAAANAKRAGKLPPELEQMYREALSGFKARNLIRRGKGKALGEVMDILEFVPEETKARVLARLLLEEVWACSTG